jgi:flagellar biosynthesis regulator FlaF
LRSARNFVTLWLHIVEDWMTGEIRIEFENRTTIGAKVAWVSKETEVVVNLSRC